MPRPFKVLEQRQIPSWKHTENFIVSGKTISMDKLMLLLGQPTYDFGWTLRMIKSRKIFEISWAEAHNRHGVRYEYEFRYQKAKDLQLIREYLEVG
jgi:hypothetical protein